MAIEDAAGPLRLDPGALAPLHRRRPSAGELGRLRRALDLVDDVLVATLAARGALVERVARAKRDAGVPASDPAREQAVRARARRLACHLALPQASAQALVDVAIDDARRRQGLAADMDQGAQPAPPRIIAPAMPTSTDTSPSPWLRLVPPPGRLAPLTRRIPRRLQRRLLERAVAAALAAPIAAGTLDFMLGRRIGIDVADLGLRWTFEMRDAGVQLVEGDAEACVRGSATDLMLLAARLEDADTLFFQRRLVLTGDTELGLTARNVLDRMPWSSVPLALRIVLNRAAALARDAREVHHARRGAA